MPTAILINPYIYDFAACDLFAKPLSLIKLADWLARRGYEVIFWDLLNPLDKEITSFMKNNPRIKISRRQKYSKGTFHSEICMKPDVLKNVPRHFRRYGANREYLEKLLKNASVKPDIVCISITMTYWYLSVGEIVDLVRGYFADANFILGGNYIRLCNDHARKMFPECILYNESDFENLKNHVSLKEPDMKMKRLRLYENLVYMPLQTSTGCFNKCPYCASSILYPEMRQFEIAEVMDDFRFYQENYGNLDIAFYDDVLLHDFNTHLKIILEEILKTGYNAMMHTPNGLQVNLIDDNVAEWLKRANFGYIRLSLESSVLYWQKESDSKVDNTHFIDAVKALHKAGYEKEDIGVYLLIGLPGQKVKDVTEAVSFVKKNGATARFSEYSPVPGTPYFRYEAEAFPQIVDEPLFQNCSLMAYRNREFDYETLEDLKRLL